MFKNKVLISGFLLGLAILAYTMMSNFKMDQQITKINPEKEKTIIQAGWEERTVGNSGIKMLAPNGLERVKVDFGVMEKVIKSKDAYSLKMESFNFYVQKVALSSGLIDTVEYSKGLAEQIGKGLGYGGYKHQIQAVKVDGKEGTLLTGTAVIGGTNMQIDAVTVSDDDHTWHIRIEYDASSEKIRSLAEKAFNSIKINFVSDKDATAKRVLETAWAVKKIGNTDINILSPEGIKQNDISMDAAAAQGLEDAELHIFKDGDFQLTLLKYVSKHDPFSPEHYAKNIAGKIQKLTKVKDYDYKMTDTNVSGIEGKYIKGLAEQTNMKKRVDSITLAEGQNLWHVALTWDSENEKLNELAQKILDSISIEQK